jgi:protease I
MSGRLDGKTVALVVANEGIEQVELVQPWEAVTSAGGEPVLVAPKDGEVQAYNHLDKGDTFSVDRTTVDATAEDFDGVVLPGGVANPDQLRTDGPGVDFLRAFAATGRPIAAICHGPWTLIEAGVIDGRTVTSWPSLRTDLENAGGNWVDRELVVDRQLITSRKPDDLPAFCDQLVSAIASTSR